ncbi:hypothetical protein Aperf_G00000113695 [Anoplocephala perfoliata]
MTDSDIPIVIDAGTQEWRAGYANSKFPDVLVEPSLQNLPKTEVVRNGVVSEFRSSQKALNYYKTYIRACLLRMSADPSTTKLLLAVPLKMSNSYRQRLTEVLFETFNFRSLFYVSQPLLAAYSSGYSNCLVVDSGCTYTGILAVKNLYPLSDSERVLPLGGRDIDRYLRQLTGTKLATCNEDDLHQIKTNYCYVASHFPKKSDCKEKVVILPDGNRITLSEELAMAPEMLFNPSLGGLPDVLPIDQSAIKSAFSLDDNDSYAVLETVVLTGGNVAFPGTSSRMKVGLATRTMPRVNKRVIKHHSGIEAVWLGGSIIASTQTYSKVCITMEAYREQGPAVAMERWL